MIIREFLSKELIFGYMKWLIKHQYEDNISNLRYFVLVNGK